MSAMGLTTQLAECRDGTAPAECLIRVDCEHIMNPQANLKQIERIVERLERVLAGYPRPIPLHVPTFRGNSSPSAACEKEPHFQLPSEPAKRAAIIRSARSSCTPTAAYALLPQDDDA